tara:strand:- start:433 stop:609 length:177 start_codon:yes stop_codon:yes gene_type:complete
MREKSMIDREEEIIDACHLIMRFLDDDTIEGVSERLENQLYNLEEKLKWCAPVATKEL